MLSTHRSSSWLLVFATLTAMVAACGGSTINSSGDAGGATGGTVATGGSGALGGTGGTSAGGVCTSACNAAASAHCPGQSKCVATCEESYAQFPSCKPQLDALIICGATNGTWQCDPGTGMPSLGIPSGVCTAETSALTNCASYGPGGYGGGGGSGSSGSCASPNCSTCSTICSTCLCVYLGDATQCTAYC